jgi:transcriptional regulator with XRE-family HTH domain
MARTNLDTKITNRIAKNVKRLRKQKGLSQYSINRQANIAPGMLSHVEAGRIKNPSLAFIIRVSKALDVTPSELTGLRL